MIAADEFYKRRGAKTVAYLSAEFLLGRALANNLIAIGLYQDIRDVLRGLGVDLADLLGLAPRTFRLGCEGSIYLSYRSELVASQGSAPCSPV